MGIDLLGDQSKGTKVETDLLGDIDLTGNSNATEAINFDDMLKGNTSNTTNSNTFNLFWFIELNIFKYSFIKRLIIDLSMQQNG